MNVKDIKVGMNVSFSSMPDAQVYQVERVEGEGVGITYRRADGQKAAMQYVRSSLIGLATKEQPCHSTHSTNTPMSPASTHR